MIACLIRADFDASSDFLSSSALNWARGSFPARGTTPVTAEVEWSRLTSMAIQWYPGLHACLGRGTYCCCWNKWLLGWDVSPHSQQALAAVLTGTCRPPPKWSCRARCLTPEVSLCERLPLDVQAAFSPIFCPGSYSRFCDLVLCFWLAIQTTGLISLNSTSVKRKSVRQRLTTVLQAFSTSLSLRPSLPNSPTLFLTCFTTLPINEAKNLQTTGFFSKQADFIPRGLCSMLWWTQYSCREKKSASKHAIGLPHHHIRGLN